jgi:hypothetical protein
MHIMLTELQAMAADPGAVAHQGIWQARLYHRLIRLVRLSDKGAKTDVSTLDYCLHILQLGSLVLHLHLHLQPRMDNPAVDTASVRRVKSTLRRLTQLRDKPQSAMTALRRLNAGSHARQLPQPELLQQAIKSCEALDSAGLLGSVPSVVAGKAVHS